MCLFAVWLVACEGSGPSDRNLRLAVDIATAGTHQPDGYTLFINGVGHPVPATGWFYHQVDGHDTFTLLLEGIPPNCRVAGPNPVAFSSSHDMVIEFHVACDWNARIAVTAVTTGADYAPAGGYGLDASWWPFGFWRPLVFIPANGSQVFGPHLAGEYEIELRVGANCVVTGENPRSVVLIHEQLVESIFEVTCS